MATEPKHERHELPRRFTLVRHMDATGVSGTGEVAQGVQFPSGKCVVCWLTAVTSVAVYDSIIFVRTIHGHDGQTEVRWDD